MSVILQFLLTGVIGVWIANIWQARAAKEARFFEASKSAYGQMLSAVETLASLSGRRIYAAQRLCLALPGGPSVAEAYQAHKEVSLEWNNKQLEIEISIRMLFHRSYLTGYEDVRSDLVEVIAKLNLLHAGRPVGSRQAVLRDLGVVRSRLFSFIQEMYKEAAVLHRQMHFGVTISYNRENISKFTTLQLFKLLLVHPEEHSSVIRPPSDFGLPVSIDDPRLRIHE